MGKKNKGSKVKPQGEELGDGFFIKIDGNICTVQFDLSKVGALSASGKTKRVASTEGNKPLEGSNVYLGFNAYVKA